MASMTERVGEMFMVGYPGLDPDAARELIQRHRVGGIILFTRNIRDAAHAREVCERLQAMRREVSDSPLFIAIDQEGGCVARITEGVTVFPGNMALGAVGSEEMAREAGAVTGAELSSLGINVNFAPVLDIGSNSHNPGVGARSFSADPYVVARLGTAMIIGMQENRVCATAKHFPGLGEALVDSHDLLPVISDSRDLLESRELRPFRAAIDVGVTFVMTAHCSFPALDETLAPATLSKRMLTELLRDQMGFEGIIITDCLEMAAVEKDFPAHKSAVMAFEAGATMLLICHTLDKQVAAMEALAQAVEDGTVSGDLVESATERTASVKGRVRFSASLRSLKPRTAMSQSMADRAVTIVKNEGSLLPLSLAAEDTLAVIVPSFDVLTKVEEAAEPHEAFLEELRSHHPNVLYRKAAVDPDDSEIRETVGTCRDAGTLLVLTYNMHQYSAQRELVRALLDTGKPVVVAAVRDPFDLAYVPNARACVATYSFRDCALKSLVKVLFGQIDAMGELPVKLPELEAT